ncbi:DegT/DnrJ/EryC1/StrS family aminotransferase [Pseudomonas sp. GOM7]|uniref:DegT/DnrJ/EryC1/StrS family aminotransferase n=1 Tax=unclassified Pseudomonas TaxID=196821 RepID=UPI00227C7E00|nr:MULTISPECIES: DegT/DnrJ/EryC1/StrS family aminotransferase [unclassified Pseudomonas]WAJ36084.1 DegT/DnrJ/EryC1/StrS family aminotransferase [Pseudomonas sp. GOM7]
MIPFLDLQRLNQRFEPEFVAALQRVLASGWFIQGEELAAFEEEFAAYCGVAHCVGVGNGLDALTLILRGYVELGRLTAGDEVILPANSFIATALAVSQAGLVPVLVEPDEATANLSPAAVGAALTTRTRALLPVHLYGRLADMRALRELADNHGLLLIEDAAQAHGAALDERRAGSFGEAAGFSFFPGKNLGALGDGGAVLTADAELAACVRQLRSYGSSRKYLHEMQGVNSRLDELQAAFLRIKLRALNADVAERDALARRYCAAIDNPHIRLPALPGSGERHAWHLFVIRSRQRDALQAHLARAGVQTLIHYPTPIHRQAAYNEFSALNLPVAQGLSEQVLSLPLYPGLTPEQVNRVIDACNDFAAIEPHTSAREH